MKHHDSQVSAGPACRQRERRLPGILVLLILVCVLAGSPAKAGDDPATAPDRAPQAKAALSSAPDFTADGLDGRTYRLKDLLKKGPVYLDFWTTYCKPCMLELPQLQKIWERYREKGFTLLGVAADDQRTSAKVKPTVLSKGFKFPNVTDPDHKIASLYNVVKYPTSVLIRPDGKIQSFAIGYTAGDEKQVEEAVLSLLKEGDAGGGKASPPPGNPE